MVPLYLPLTLEDVSQETPIFYGGIGVFLRQYAQWLPSSWTRWLVTAASLGRWLGKRPGHALRIREPSPFPC